MDIFIAELIGTMVLILLGDGVVAGVLLKGSKAENGGWIVITTGWGLAVSIAVYVCGWVSGGHINPAVTFAFALVGKTAWGLVPVYVCGQLVGAMLGACLVYITYHPHWAVSDNPDHKLMVFCTKPAIEQKFWNLMCEIIGTAILILGLMGIIDKHNELGSGLGPYLFGMLVFAIGLSLGGPTGYAINPARDLGPRVMHSILPIHGKGSSEWHYCWVPIIGPLIGSAIGVAIFIAGIRYM